MDTTTASSRWAAIGFTEGPPGLGAPQTPADRVRTEAARAVLPSAIASLEAGITAGLAPGMQLYVSRWGEPVARFAAGWARPDLTMSTDTLMPWYCSVKPLVAIAFARLWEEGCVGLDQPVHEICKEFGGGGKDAITFRHLLTHTAGVRPDPGYQTLWGTRSETYDALLAAKVADGTRPGDEAYYAQFWAWHVLAEVIERVCGHGYEKFIGEEILRPIGVSDVHLRLDASRYAEIEGRLGRVYDTDSDQAPQAFFASSEPSQFDLFAPGVLAVGSAESIGKILEILLPSPPHPVLRPQTVAAVTARHRVGLWDEHWGGFMSWGLGVAVEGAFFGNRCSPRSFGHLGINTSHAVCDPDEGLVVASISNGFVGFRNCMARDRGLVDACYEDLGLRDGCPAPPRILNVEPQSCQGIGTARLEARYWKPSYQNTQGEHIRSELTGGGEP